MNKDEQIICMIDETKEILEDLLRERPDYGVVGMTCHFHAGRLQRVVTTKESSLLKQIPASAV